MSREQKIAEAREAARLPLPADAPWWWLSFAHEDGFRGLVITRGSSFIDAIARAHLLGIAPGGQVFGPQIPDEIMTLIEPSMRDRCLSKDEAATLAALTEGR